MSQRCRQIVRSYTDKELEASPRWLYAYRLGSKRVCGNSLNDGDEGDVCSSCKAAQEEREKAKNHGG